MSDHTSQAVAVAANSRGFFAWFRKRHYSGLPNTWGYSHWTDEDDPRHMTHPDRPRLPGHLSDLYHFEDTSIFGYDIRVYRPCVMEWDGTNWQITYVHLDDEA